MTPGFVGVDVAFAKGKRLPIVIARWENGRLVPYPLRQLPFEPPRGLGNVAALNDDVVQEFSATAVAYVKTVCAHLQVEPVRIALDAPSGVTPSDRPRRQAEQALDQAGIHCFTTPSALQFSQIREKVDLHLVQGGAENRLPHANQLWMLVGFALFEAFKTLASCIEVFPQATVRVMASAQAHKSKPEGIAAQLAAAARFTGWPESGNDVSALQTIAWSPRHDALDSYLSAWVAALDEGDRIALGSPPDDVIWVPKLAGLPVPVRRKETALSAKFRNSVNVPTTDSSPSKRIQPPAAETAYSRICPACNAFTFKRWPFGWDAHAAHKCTGLTSSDPEARKQEFRRQYLAIPKPVTVSTMKGHSRS